MNDILSNTVALYIGQFNQFLHTFLSWGQWLFFGLVTIHLAWKWLWAAFEGQSLLDAFPPFLKEIFILGFFYTLMVHTNWIFELLPTVQTMGSQVTHSTVEPSRLISMGIMIGNRMTASVSNTGLLHMNFSVVLVLIAYIFVLYVFIKIALEVAVTLIVTTALINLSAFLLGFSAFSETRRMAYQTLEVILGNCIKLLGFYMVIGVSQNAFQAIENIIPQPFQGYDPYVWLCATVLLFYLLAENLPHQLARIVSGLIHDNNGTSPMALASSAIQAFQTTKQLTSQIGKLAGKLAGITAIGLEQVKETLQRASGGQSDLSQSSSKTEQSSSPNSEGHSGSKSSNSGVKEAWQDLASRLNGQSSPKYPDSSQAIQAEAEAKRTSLSS